VGHPLLYSTTKDFLIYFGLKSLDALPTIKEIREMEIQ
jgi:segregation and condensation protein B